MTEAESMKSWTRGLVPYAVSFPSGKNGEFSGVSVANVDAQSNKSGSKLYRVNDRWFLPEALTVV